LAGDLLEALAALAEASTVRGAGGKRIVARLRYVGVESVGWRSAVLFSREEC
jgi:hypothetical protein